jgi:small subunit ribosomal protein S18
MRERRKPRTAKKDRDFLRKRSRHLEEVTDIGVQDYDLLRKFVTEHGKIIPARLTGATAKQQRQIKRGVRRARVMGLIP